MIRKLALLAFIIMLTCVPLASATAFTVTNSTLRTNENETYPETLFYAIFMVGAVMIVFDIRFLTQQKTPGVPLLITSTLGFATFLICAYMAPMVVKQVWVVNAAEAEFISTYVFSPWVSFLMLGLSGICFIMIWYGALRIWFEFAEKDKIRKDPDHQFEMYMKTQ